MNANVSRRRVVTNCAIVLFVALIASCSVATAQYQTVTLADPVYVRSLSGHIQDPNKDAVKDAQVELFDSESKKLLASTHTDAKGDFHFRGFGKNEYKVKITSPGFDPLEAKLRIRKNATESVVLTLTVAT